MMKNPYSFVLAFLFVAISCSNDKEPIEGENLLLNVYPQTWKLVKMTGSFKDSESVGLDMEWQENYIFKSDGTFTKTRLSEGESLTATGTYIFEADGQKFLLDYDESSPIIGTCGPETKEHLYFDKDGKMLLSNWWACDGPGLFYERIE